MSLFQGFYPFFGPGFGGWRGRIVLRDGGTTATGLGRALGGIRGAEERQRFNFLDTLCGRGEGQATRPGQGAAPSRVKPGRVPTRTPFLSLDP